MYTPEELNNIGAMLIEKGEYDLAINALTEAYLKDSTNPTILTNLAQAHASNGNPTTAKNYFQKALKLNDKMFEALHSLGFIYLEEGDKKNAIVYFEKAIKIKKSNDLTANLAFAYQDVDPDKAQYYFKRSINKDPDNIWTRVGLAYTFIEKEDHASAVRELEKIVNDFPNHSKAYSLLNFEYLQTLEWDKSKGITPQVDKFLRKSLQDPDLMVTEEPQMNLIRCRNSKLNYQVAKKKSYEIALQTYQKNKELGIMNYEYKKKVVIDNWKLKNKRIRVGYLSDGFRDFPTGHKLLPVFKYSNKNNFETFIYSYGRNDKSNFRVNFERYADHFVDLYQQSDAAIENQIKNDKLDILVDLKGHTLGNKMQILAKRLAPLQISWLGFPGTTGADFIDYAIVDHVVVPRQDEKYWSERLLFMPHTYQIAMPQENTRKKNKPPRPKDRGILQAEKFDLSFHPRAKAHGISAQNKKANHRKIVVANFNFLYKLDKNTFKAWVNILKATPNSVFWQIHSNELANTNFIHMMAKSGIKKSRIIILPRLPKNSHIKRVWEADLVLDTLQVNGHTSTIDALSMGVPVVTMQGSHFASRVSESILKAAKLDYLVAKTHKEYEKIAIKLLATPLKLNLDTTPLFSSRQFVKDYEKLLLSAWKNQ